MKAKLLILAAILQFGVLAYMAGEREAVVHTGRTIYLRTMPVDPRDIFRGDYVRLSYEISNLDARLWSDSLKQALTNSGDRATFAKDMRVFVSLKVDERGLAFAEGVTDRQPGDGLYLRGRVEYAGSHGLSVRYGLEAYFMQQGKGLELERGRSRDDRIRVPLEMEVAVSGRGLAVLKGYRWSPLGIGLSIESDKDRNRRPISAKLSLHNASDRPLAIVDLPGGRSFTLEPDLMNWWQKKEWTWVGEGTPRPAATDDHVRVLQPGETVGATIPFSDSAWFIRRDKGAPQSLAEQEGGWKRFRFVYDPPSAAETAGLKNADLIWHGHLHSSAFAGGYVD
jgi:uncharacterized membrane-anchored protein